MTDFDFEPGENADAIREATSRFAKDRIAPLAARIDAEDWFPRELWPEMGALGLHGITIEEADGGLGLGYLEHVVAQEEVARASASIGLSYGAHSNLCVNQIRRWANAEQKSRYLPKLIYGEHVGSLAMSEAGGATLLASENAMKTALEAVQALGGARYTKDWPVECYKRAAKLLDIGAGTNEIRRMLIGRELIGA